ncbi:hypothetical protein AwPolaro_06890 [Polaromonas sp.]|nr:hypothetical protein AwPolaro_06890 [Polaromonas sp.]
MLQQISRDHLSLAFGETYIAHQLHFPHVTQQLKACMNLYTHDMNVGRAMVV